MINPASPLHPYPRQIPAIMCSQKTNNDNQQRRNHHRRKLSEYPVNPHAAHCPHNRRTGINMLDKNIGRLPGHHIPQKPAAHSGQGSKHRQQKSIFPIPLIHPGHNPHNRKNTQAKGIHNQHNPIIHNAKPSLQNIFPKIQYSKDKKRCYHCRQHINRFDQRSRHIAQNNIPRHPPAHSRHYP